jgi:hypothetical protein
LSIFAIWVSVNRACLMTGTLLSASYYAGKLHPLLALFYGKVTKGVGVYLF